MSLRDNFLRIGFTGRNIAVGFSLLWLFFVFTITVKWAETGMALDGWKWLLFNDQSIFEAMDRDEIADGNSRAGVLLGLFQISIIGSLFLAIPINLVGLIFLKIKAKMGNEQV